MSTRIKQKIIFHSYGNVEKEKLVKIIELSTYQPEKKEFFSTNPYLKAKLTVKTNLNIIHVLSLY